MTTIWKPETSDQVLEAVQWAASHKESLEIVGHATKRGFGAPVHAQYTLDMSGLSGIELYEPEELVMTVKAGTPMTTVQEALDDAHQMLAFDPWMTDHIFGTQGGTVGGVFAVNAAGPRRPLAGAARDHLLGFHAVSGRGEVFKSGGRVVKNVTGFDLSKLMAGSFGTLAVMTDISFKVLPRPEKTRTVLVRGATDPAQTMRNAQNSPYEVSGVAHLPLGVAKRSAVSRVSGAGGAITAVRVEGPEPSVKARCLSLRELLSPFGDVEELHTHNSLELWREIRDVSVLPTDKMLWRISVPQTDGPCLAASWSKTSSCEYYFDWAGGLVWVAQDAANASAIQGDVTDGHATLMRAPQDVRETALVFQPQPSGLAALSERVRAGFDPYGILNPGRMGKRVEDKSS